MALLIMVASNHASVRVTCRNTIGSFFGCRKIKHWILFSKMAGMWVVVYICTLPKGQVRGTVILGNSVKECLKCMLGVCQHLGIVLSHCISLVTGSGQDRCTPGSSHKRCCASRHCLQAPSPGTLPLGYYIPPGTVPLDCHMSPGTVPRHCPQALSPDTVP